MTPMAKKSNSFVESLEPRVKFAIYGADLFGPTVVGTRWVYDLTGTLAGKTTHTVSERTIAGTAKIAGYSTFQTNELDTNVSSVPNTKSTHRFYNIVSKADGIKSVQDYYSATYFGTTTSSVSTFSAPLLVLPAQIDAGKIYRFNSVDQIKSLTTGRTTSYNVSGSIKLVSGQKTPITTTAGTFHAYFFRSTVVTTTSHGTATADYQFWYVPGVGLAKSITTASGSTMTFALKTFKAVK